MSLLLLRLSACTDADVEETADDSDAFAPALTALHELIGADTIPALEEQYVEWREDAE